jgi:cytochrome c-type biogenesis protein CcmH
MRRLVAAAAVALVLPASASAACPELRSLEGELMCPTCGTTLELSNAPAANQIRRYVCERAAAGDSNGEIRDQLVADFGPGVLASPPKKGFDLLAWVLPLLALGAGAAVLAGLVVRWSRRREPEPKPGVAGEPSANGRAELDPELEKRLDEELARFD